MDKINYTNEDPLQDHLGIRNLTWATYYLSIHFIHYVYFSQTSLDKLQNIILNINIKN